MNYLMIGDPSGSQTLRLLERGVFPGDIYVYDPEPKGRYYATMRGATVTDDLDTFMGMKFDIVVGNPPYGSGGNDAIKFLNKCGELSDDIRFVMPISIRKPSSQNKVRLDLVCVEDEDLSLETFGRGIKAVRQRWVKTDNLREKIDTFSTHPDFAFTTVDKANVMIGRIGSGPAGRVKLTDFGDYCDTHYFLKVDNPQVIQNLVDLEPTFREVASQANGRKSLSKHELITLYIERYGV